MTTTTLSPERQREVDIAWQRRKGSWQAPFSVILNDVMVHVFWDAEDFDAVQAYLTERWGS